MLTPGDMLAANPRLSSHQAAAVLAERYGIVGRLRDLGSLQDQNFRVDTDAGERYVLKIARPAETRSALELQNAAMRHVVRRRAESELLDFDSPDVVATLDLRDIVSHDGHSIRLLTWVEGTPLADVARLGASDVFGLGALAGQTATALADFVHPAMHRELWWDARRAAEVVGELIHQVADPAHRALVERAIVAHHELVALDPDLPRQVVHADITDVNVVRHSPAGSPPLVRGVLDFGDVMHTWRVSDAAATATGVTGHEGVDDVLAAVLGTLAGYQSACPLTDAELEAFWPLVLTRCATDLVVSDIQFQLNPTSAYTRTSAEVSVRSLQRVLDVPSVVARAAVRLSARASTTVTRAGLASGVDEPAELVSGLSRARLVDLSVTSDDFAYGEWSDADALAQLISTDPVTIGRWGEARMTLAPGPATRAPATLRLGADVFAAAGTPVHAPVPATVVTVGAQQIVLDPGPSETALLVRLDGVSPQVSAGSRVAAGERLGSISASVDVLPARVGIQLLSDPELPGHGSSAHRAAWLTVCPDPSPLLGRDVAAPQPPDPRMLRAQRDAHVATSQHLYYAEPPEIVRGWRHFLYDSAGRQYLDMINNIASVGHTHPAVTRAATAQLRRLNTNSRFLYDSMSRYAQRIAELLPAELGAVFFVNSGSEAADLAVQLARVHTARRDLIALAGAYHGWTGAVLDVSTSPVDRPRWREDIQPYVHIVEQPDPYRGVFGSHAQGYLDSVRTACDVATARGGPAAFVSEPLLGNQGAVEPPPGFLAGAYDIVRAAGGLCLADEVQVGMGRTGSTFWAFEHESVVPDIVYTAKATGNGHPLGVVACRPDIAAGFDGRTAYFSSTGGGPVSCEVGLAVLDVIRDEGLQRNAAETGAYLKRGLLALAERHEVIGAVHGRGLYLGVDLVSDRGTKTPATEVAAAVSDRLLELGVVMAPTGDAMNVLKVKPPLCIDVAAADFFLLALDRALGETPRS